MGPGTLTTTIDQMLDLDPTALTDDELHQWVTGLHRDCSRLAAVRASLLSVWGRPAGMGRRRLPVRFGPAVP